MTTQTREKTGWPSENLRFLLKACLAKEGAKQAWLEWLQRRNINDVNWAELRLLAAFANRIDEIDPGSPEKPRLEGIRRFVWAKNQLRLDRCIQVIDILQRAHVPVMLLKGMGRIASNPTLASSRFVRDIDILIPPEKIPVACDALIFNGWRPVTGMLPGLSRAEPFGRLFISGPDGKQDEDDFHVDIHRSVIHYGRSGTFDDIFWTRCRKGQLRGRIVNVPSETDQFLHAIIHATIADPARPVDWVIDAMDAAKGIDWHLLEVELDRRRAGAAVADTLGFLEADLGLQVPDGIKRIIKRDSLNPLFNLEVQVYWRLPEDRIRYGGIIRNTAEWVRSRHCLYKAENTRQTLWEGQKVQQARNREREQNLIRFFTPIAEYKLYKSAQKPENRLIMELEITANSYDVINFDLLLNGIWFGRLMTRPSKSEINDTIRRYFDVSVPEIFFKNTDEMDLHFILLDQNGRVPAGMPYNLSVHLLFSGNPVTPQQCSVLSGAGQDKFALISQVKADCLL